MSVTPQRPGWVANAAAIGLTIEQAGVVQTLVDDCRAKYNLAQEKRNEALAATTNQTAAFEAMDTFGAQMIKIIRAFGVATDDAAVFATAQIPEPKQPEPRAPVNPSNVMFNLEENGALEIRWEGTIVPGTSFLVDRQTWTGTGQPTPFVRIATATERRFVDTAVPAGTVTATYRVSALKGGQQTPGAQSTAHFVFVGNGPAQLVIPPESDAA